MIFSYNELTKVERLMTHFYNKILLVDFENDSYKIIKMDDSEYKERKDTEKKFSMSPSSFYEWITGFKNSRDSMNLNYNFDLDILKNLDLPLILDYKKRINGEMKDVTMELVPIGESQAYVLVKDYSIKLPPRCKGECDRCQKHC